MTSHPSTAVSPSDADLVQRSLSGGPSAFAEIVARYQTLICSLTYNGTGSLSRSEDVAQEVFVTAWKELRQLREPSKLRSWLCGIARRLTANSRRRDQREPVHAAEELDAEHHSPSPDPSEQTISREEEAILWRSLDEIPETYREPLILFYREGQSVENVARSLELTEDAAKQRLSRGRKMLQEQVAHFVEGALRQSTPGRAFTLGVIASLPLMAASSASAAALGVTAAKGSAAAKAAGFLGIFSMLIGPVMGCVGGWIGMKASLVSAQSERELRLMRRQSKVMVALAFGGAVIMALVFMLAGKYWTTQPLLAVLLVAVLTAGYVVGVLINVARNLRERRRLHAEVGPTLDPEMVALRARAWKTTEYRSRWTLLGLPLIHLRIGRPAMEKLRPAVGWIAIGDMAFGVLFAAGGISVGGISTGGLSLGVIAAGGLAAGAIAWGGLAFGLWAVGGLAVGRLAFGGIAFAWHAALGGLSMAHDFALGDQALAAHANDEAARIALRSLRFFQHAQESMLWVPVICWLPMLVVLWQGKRALRIVRENSEALAAQRDVSGERNS